MDAKYQIVSLNKDYVHAETVRFGTTNRAFRYGDGFFETMHANGLQIQFVNDHFVRIQSALKVLSLELPDYFTVEFLKSQVSGLLSRCKLFQAARVKLTVFRSGGGFYFPDSNKADFIIESEYLGKGQYELNKNSLTIGLYSDIAKPQLPFLQFKGLNSQFYILAALFAQSNNFNDVLLLNEKGAIVEATSSNVFVVSEKVVQTPSLNTGCVKGVMRKQVIDICNFLGYKVLERDDIVEQDLLQADEIFLTNAVFGLKYISGFKNRRYYNRNSRKIMARLNEIAF